MSDHKLNLYFVALVPHIELQEHVKAFKKEIKEWFNAKYALKSPAHIILQMPFRISNEDEPYLIGALQELAASQNAFMLKLSGFGCFSPRVIFVKVIDCEALISIHAKLKRVLMEKMAFKEHVVTTNIHPYMTIAIRDLSVKAFRGAWGEFEKREFEASFLSQSLFLLKHNGKFWDIYRGFLFK